VTLLALKVIDSANPGVSKLLSLTKKLKPSQLHLINNGFAKTLQFIHDNCTEFVGIDSQEMLVSYGIQAVIMTIGIHKLIQLFNAYIMLFTTCFTLPILSRLQLKGFALSNKFMQHNGQSRQIVLNHCMHICIWPGHENANNLFSKFGSYSTSQT